MSYTAHIKKEVDGYTVTFPDLDGCFSEGDTREQAIYTAKEALDGYLAASCDRELAIPEATTHTGPDYVSIPVDSKIAIPIMLRRLRKTHHWTQSHVAKLLDVSQQAYAKLETAGKANPTIETLERLSHIFHVHFDYRFVA